MARVAGFEGRLGGVCGDRGLGVEPGWASVCRWTGLAGVRGVRGLGGEAGAITDAYGPRGGAGKSSTASF